jgi:hypothetical protein
MRITNGNVGIGTTSPTQPLHMGGGAYCTGTVWTDASSIEYKKNVVDLTSEEAFTAMKELNPVKFNYKTEEDEEYLGFIGEEVPELVAMGDRKGLSAMDIVAVLVKVVQDQQATIEELEKRLAIVEAE